jgi:hypothetical protein
MKNVVFWHVASYGSCENWQYASKLLFFASGFFLPWKMRRYIPPETTVLTRLTRRHITEDRILHKNNFNLQTASGQPLMNWLLNEIYFLAHKASSCVKCQQAFQKKTSTTSLEALYATSFMLASYFTFYSTLKMEVRWSSEKLVNSNRTQNSLVLPLRYSYLIIMFQLL